MAELSIKVTIANRVYPLKINDSEEENIRKAARLINEKAKEYEENFSVRDKQDLLAMAALQFASESLNGSNKISSDLETAGATLSEMDELISGYLDHLPVQPVKK